MRRPVYTVDAFTDQPFSGNPAAVCLLEATPDDEAWMAAVAREMNLSETAFVSPRPNGDGFDLRWFTPAVEVDLCGHATLASAHALWESGRVPPARPARFHTRSGWLTCTRSRDGRVIEMDFPAKPATPAEALGARPVHVANNRMDYLVELADEAAVRALRPDLRALRSVKARGVIVTARSQSPGFDFVSRFFAPAPGRTRTRSPALRTAASGRSGGRGSGRRSSPAIRRPPAAAWWACASPATASSSAARR